MSQKTKTLPETRTMRYWLAESLKELRAGRPRADVVSHMRERGHPVSESTLSRFESGGTAGFAESTDAIVAGYVAKWGNGKTTRQIWLAALLNWMERGGAPYLDDATPEVLAVLAAAEADDRLLAARLRKLGGVESPAKPNTKSARRKSR